MHFDPRAAKLLQPNEFLTVANCPGLRLKANKTARTWIYRYRSPQDGKIRQVKIGEWPAMPLADAIKQWGDKRSERNAGRDVAAEKRAERQAKQETKLLAVTVREICNNYLTGHIKAHRKQAGADEIARIFNTMLGKLADKHPTDVTRAAAFDLIASYKHIPVQAKRLRAELAAAWEYAYDSGRLAESVPNWWRQIMRGKLRSKGKKIKGESVGAGKRVLSEAETGELVRWLPNFSRLIEDALTLYLWTGTRGAEIMAIEGHEVTEEPDGLWWTIPKRKTKNARHAEATDHRVPLIGRAETIVRRRAQTYGSGYLFPTVTRAGEPTHSQQKIVSERVYYHQPYCEIRPEQSRPRLTVTRWGPHDLRRTVRTLLASLGCQSDIAEVIIGHMLKGVEGTYNKYTYDRERRFWLTKLNARLEELAAMTNVLPIRQQVA